MNLFLIVTAMGGIIFVLMILVGSFAALGREGFTFARARLGRKILAIWHEYGQLGLKVVKDPEKLFKDSHHIISKIYQLKGVRVILVDKKRVPTADLKALSVIEDLQRVGYTAQYVTEDGLVVPYHDAYVIVEKNGENGVLRETIHISQVQPDDRVIGFKLPFRDGAKIYKAIMTKNGDTKEIEFFEPLSIESVKGWLNSGMNAGILEANETKRELRLLKSLANPMDKLVSMMPVLIPLIFVIGIEGYLIISTLQGNQMTPDDIAKIVKVAVQEAVKSVSGQPPPPVTISSP